MNTLNMEALDDEKYWATTLEFGRNALEWRQRFIGALPGIEARGLWAKHGFGSMVEFAAKVGGVSPEQTKRVLSVHKKFADAPELQALLVNGEVSVNKLARVASVATPANAAAWAEQVKRLPQKAVETLVRDVKQKDASYNVVRAHKLEDLVLTEAVVNQLFKLKGKGFDLSQLLGEMLEKRKLEIEDEKLAIAEETKTAKSRYIPKRVREIVKKEHGEICSVPGCNKKAGVVIHHALRFAMARTHDPRFLAPLCREHHTIAHAIDLKVQNRMAPA